MELWKAGDWDSKSVLRPSADVWVKSRTEIILKKVTLAYQQITAVSSVTVTATNIYNKLLLQRIKPHLTDAYFYKRPHLWCLTRFWIHLFLHPFLRINQRDFTAGRSTIAQILSLRILIGAIKEGQLTNVFTFDDFSKVSGYSGLFRLNYSQKTWLWGIYKLKNSYHANTY